MCATRDASQPPSCANRRKSIPSRTYMKSHLQLDLNFSHRCGERSGRKPVLAAFDWQAAQTRDWRETIMRSKKVRVLVTGVAAIAIGIYAEIGFSGEKDSVKKEPVDSAVANGAK